MNRELFGTDGIRGKAGTYPLDTATIMQIGSAIGSRFSKPGEYILLGHDPRESSLHIVAALTAGLTATGAQVKIIGVLPTPGLAYLTGTTDAAAGVMVTASHNPYSDNGIKVFDRSGGKLSDEAETALNAAIKNNVFTHHFSSWEKDSSLIGAYEDFLIKSAEGTHFEGVRLALDTANGAASGIAERVFKRLGAEVTPLSDKPDGRNINETCGANHPQALQNEVITQDLQMGVAFDGDADRVVLVDEQGRECTGDHVLYILAVTGRHKAVVATIMSNMGMEIALRDRGIKLERRNVGDRYVLEGLQQTGLKLGGEQSGHIILPDLLATGDGMLAAIQTIKAVQASGRTLGEWRDDISLLPQTIVNIPLADTSLLANPEIQAFIAQQTAALDGKGRINVRPSGTEPLLRVMAEVADAQTVAEAVAAKLQQLLKSIK